MALGTLIILGGFSPNLPAATSDDPEAQLESVRKRILELGRRLTRTRAKRDKLTTGLGLKKLSPMDATQLINRASPAALERISAEC